MKNRIRNVVAALLVIAPLAEAGPSTSVTRTYKAVFDLEYDVTGGVVGQPLMELQNPKANLYPMTVTRVNDSCQPVHYGCGSCCGDGRTGALHQLADCTWRCDMSCTVMIGLNKCHAK